MPSSPGHAAACACSAAMSSLPSAAWQIVPFGRTQIADAPRQRARVDAGETDQIVRNQPGMRDRRVARKLTAR